MITKEEIEKLRAKFKKEAEENPTPLNESIPKFLDAVGNGFVMLYDKIEKLDARLATIEEKP